MLDVIVEMEVEFFVGEAVSPWQEADEAFLLEVVVGGQGFADLSFAHQDEADGIAERVRFILTIL